jgi:hypothetical protein
VAQEGRSEPGGVAIAMPVVFEQLLGLPQRQALDRLRAQMLAHRFELHDIQPSGESLVYVPVADHIRTIEIGVSPAQPEALVFRFTVNSKQDKEALVWTTSLLFQYIHYHVARIATINGAPQGLDWEAQQDPQSPARVKRWVEQGQSLIERLHKTRH